ncbi:peptidoglycan-binding protein [[Actinomadura] parvosata]|uniref:peptidoglycan-binding protein n=2 Tax=[Actinomadura] parvosata TaxID=1955412 RepID=UPI001E5C91A5|nr:peptidoglycan-binding protein [Nonomuraea sp. ATCC 55076]
MAIDLVVRRDWSARAPRGDYTQLDSTKGVKVHYTGGLVSPGIVTDHDACVALVRSIQGYHMDGNGWIDIGYCADEETEILTRQGWVSYRRLRAGDLVLTLDHETGLSEWQPVIEVCVFPARPREMIRMEGAGHSSLTTPAHRWPVERGAGRPWVTTETMGPGDRMVLAAPCADLPAEAKWSDAFVQLVAWFSAGQGDGLASPVRDAGVRAALRSVFGTSAWRELPAPARRELDEVAPGRVPGHAFLLSLTRAQLSLFVETVAGGERVAAFGERAAAEAFLLAVLLTGAPVTLRQQSRGGWQVRLGRRRTLAPHAAQRKGRLTITREPYHGEIWCPRTANQSWLARRAGTVYFTGNSYVACPHQKVFEGRGLHHLPAANGPGLNAGHYAVLGLVGNAGLVEPTDGILNGILDAVQYVRDYGRAGKEIKGHRDGYSTDCPGEPLYAWVRRGAPRPGGGSGPPAPPAAPPFPGRLLKYPPVMRGEDVRTWQEQMRRRGFDLAADGAYGARSREACLSFQRQQGITGDGIVGPLTWRLTWEAPSA